MNRLCHYVIVMTSAFGKDDCFPARAFLPLVLAFQDRVWELSHAAKFKWHLSYTFSPFFVYWCAADDDVFTGRFSDTIRSARSRAFALAGA